MKKTPLPPDEKQEVDEEARRHRERGRDFGGWEEFRMVGIGWSVL